MKSLRLSLFLSVGIGFFFVTPLSGRESTEIVGIPDTVDVEGKAYEDVPDSLLLDVREVLGLDTVNVDKDVHDILPDTMVISVEYKGDPDADPSTLSVDTLYDYYKKLKHEQDSIDAEVEEVRFNLQMLARSYGDSIVIRWAPDEYVPWKFLNGKGVWLIRYEAEPKKPGEDEDEGEVKELAGDTLALLKPMNKYEFAKLFSDTDTMAFAAMQTIFGEGTKLGNTRSAPNSAGSIMEVYEEQQNVFGMAMVIAERRADISAAMGLRYVDKKVKRGATYTYYLTPNLTPDVLKVSPAMVDIENLPFEPKPCTLELEDSIAAVDGILLSWPYTNDYSSFDIERRKQGQKDWVVLNKKPYLSMVMDLFEGDEPPGLYADTGVEPGTYTYRLRGYDSFGDKSGPGPEHEVTLPDLLPPAPPRIKLITIERGDTTITARIDWHKDEIEPDLIGYIPFYQYGTPENLEELAEEDRNTNVEDSTLYGGRWVPLVQDRVLAPTDSSVVVDVRGLSTGMVTIAAVDSAMNMTYAMPMPMRIEDLEPPMPPTNLRGLVSAEGVVTLGWTPSRSPDTYYYEVFMANDTTHTFVLVPNQQQYTDTLFKDTLSLEVNHPFKYYKVRTIDWAGNNSEFTEPLRVVRPNFNAPSECFIDTSWVTQDSIYMRWVISPEKDLDKVRVFRRLSNEAQWTMIQTFYQDEVNGKSTIEVVDRPEPNQTIRYYYAIEAINMTGVSTGLSMQTCYLFQGQRMFDIPIKLDGGWREDKKRVVLAWDAPEELPIVAPYHFVLSRQLEGEDFFRSYRSIKSDQRSFEDRRMKPGESTVYRLEILFEDGRRSTPSNEVKVTVPKEKE